MDKMDEKGIGLELTIDGHTHARPFVQLRIFQVFVTHTAEQPRFALFHQDVIYLAHFSDRFVSWCQKYTIHTPYPALRTYQ